MTLPGHQESPRATRSLFDQVSVRVRRRWVFLTLLLIAEVLWGTNVLSTPESTPKHGLLPMLVWHGSWLLDFGLAMVAATLLILAQRLRPILGALAQQSGYRWWPWVALHGVSLAALLGLSWPVFGPAPDPSGASVAWLVLWIGCVVVTLIALLLAAAPLRRWLNLARAEWRALAAGVAAGIVAWSGGLIAQGAWNRLTGVTLWAVHQLLAALTSTVHFEPSVAQVGMGSFIVQIDRGCSGYEGVVLVAVFVTIYLWLFRSELRFPRAYLLLPIGVIAIWLANVLRIAALIIIGALISPDIALGGFHSQAGWIGFIVVALGLIAISHRHLLAASAGGLPANAAGNSMLAMALVAPLLTQLASAMIIHAFSAGFPWLYPLGVIATALVLWRFRHHYRSLPRDFSWQSMAVGVAVFALWMWLMPPRDDAGTLLAPTLAAMPWWLAAMWVLFRIVGSVITVPIAEELAFRGYLIRKLISRNFETVPAGLFNWLSFIVSSFSFGLLHQNWLAGSLAGAGFAIALYRRGRLCDAIVAHMTTNALIAIAVLAFGSWHLWT